MPAVVRAVLTTVARAVVMLFALSCSSPSTPAGSDSLIVAFDSLWQRYDRTYPYFEYKHIDWDAARANFRARAARANSAEELAAIVRQMLGALRDVHSSMSSPAGAWVPTYTTNGAAFNYRLPVWREYLRRAGGTELPADWGYGHFGPVPYLYFASWTAGKFTVAAVDSVLEKFRDAPALVIDVRMNGGGSDELSYGVATRFFDAPHVTGSVQFRNGPRHSDLSDPIVRTLAPRGSWQFRRPVLLLTGRAVFSSAENFTMAMRVLPHVTVVGDTTGGGSGNPTQYRLAGGWRYNLPRWLERTAGGDIVEWRGLAPSLVIPFSTADFEAGRDPVLDYAIAWAATAGRR